MTRLAHIGLSIAQFALSAWIGAASLFVLLTISQVRAAKFSSIILDEMFLIKFPHFYQYGFTLILLATLGTAFALRGQAISKIGGVVCLAMVLLALGIMIYDYYTIYLPLVELITPPGKARTAQFQTLHVASKNINTVGLSLCIAALIGLFWTNSALSKTK